MATSQNGYSANDRSVIGSYALPGGMISMRKGDVSVVLLWVAQQFNAKVERLIWPGNWGYAERTIRGSSTTLSNHASGTAIDLNAPRHPLGRVGTFNAVQRAAIHSILAYCEGVVRWGGDYTGRKDEMHFEINAGSASVARIANKIRAAGGIAPVPTGGTGSKPASSDIKWIQSRLTYWGFPTGIDGYPGPKTTAAIKAFQTAKKLTADGLVGPKTRAALAANKPVPSGPTQYKPIPLGGVSTLYTTGQQVKNDQAGLKNRGYAMTVDGYWGPGSVAVAKQFQSAAGITVDGAIGPVSRRIAGKVPHYVLATPKAWQQRLKDRGWRITVDGIWGPQSVSILKQFQAEKRLHASGTRNPETWTALWTRST